MSTQPSQPSSNIRDVVRSVTPISISWLSRASDNIGNKATDFVKAMNSTDEKLKQRLRDELLAETAAGVACILLALHQQRYPR